MLLLEELVTSELEGTLKEVTSKSRTDTSQESGSALILDDLAETADHAPVVGGRVELDTGLDAVGDFVSDSPKGRHFVVMSRTVGFSRLPMLRDRIYAFQPEEGQGE